MKLPWKSLKFRTVFNDKYIVYPSTEVIEHDLHVDEINVKEFKIEEEF